MNIGNIIDNIYDKYKDKAIDSRSIKPKVAKTDISYIVGLVFDNIDSSLEKGESVSIRNHGTYVVQKRAARTGRNPRTKEEIRIEAAIVPRFKPSAQLREKINKCNK